MMIAIYSQAILKLVYLDWRPVFLSAEIDSKYCEADYGKPSGHALTSVIMIPLTLSILVKPTTSFSRFIILVVTIILLSGILLSRLYFGKHSINQLFLGAAFGLFLYCLFFHILDEWLNEKFFKPILFDHSDINKAISMELNVMSDEEIFYDDNSQKNNSEDDLPNSRNILIRSRQSDLTKTILLLRAGMFIFILTNCLMIIGFVIARNYVEFPTSHFFSEFKNCSYLKTKIDSVFSNKVIRDGGFFNIAFGLFLGHIFSIKRNLSKLLNSNNNDAIVSSKNVFQAFRVLYDNKSKFIFIRIFFILIFFPLIGIPHLSGLFLKNNLGAALNVMLGLGVPLLIGLLLGFLYIPILDKLKIPYYQIENSEVSKIRSEINNIE